MDKVVGIVGIGIMGGAMARNLMKDGFRVVGYDVSDAAMEAFASAGGERAGSPREVAERTRLIITSLPSVAALHAAASGNDGLTTAKGEGQIVVECSTLPLAAKQEAYEALARRGKILLDCPVSGTGAQAARKDLVVFASGDERAFEQCKDVFAGMSRAQKYLGAFGNGSKMKFVANHLVTIHNVAAAEALVLGMKSGLDPQMIYDVISDSAGASRMFQVRGPMMVKGKYDEVTATSATHLKDIGIISEFAASLSFPMPVFNLTAQYYHAAVGQGRGQQDTGAVCAVVESLGGKVRGE
ncbi:MAG TPA: NAD(P)-dependent oxidoreductase [Xanthobacteraceae bacterium]|nr:NAD(P)-dependent oxidoreductase [Xanthobacteraceae bacterium]